MSAPYEANALSTRDNAPCREVFKLLSKNQNQNNYPTNHNRSRQRDEPITIPSNYLYLEARENSRVHGAIGFGFASRWLKNWRESCEPVTKRSNLNGVITFDSHLKIAL